MAVRRVALCLGLTIATPSLCLAGGEEEIRQGMSLKNAMHILLSSGWQGVQLRWQDKELNCQYNDLCNLPETRACLPTGTGACYLEYTDLRKRKLVLEVNGRGEPRLIRFFFDN